MRDHLKDCLLWWSEIFQSWSEFCVSQAKRLVAADLTSGTIASKPEGKRDGK